MFSENRQMIRPWWGRIGFQSGELIESEIHDVQLGDGSKWVRIVWRFWLRVS